MTNVVRVRSVAWQCESRMKQRMCTVNGCSERAQPMRVGATKAERASTPSTYASVGTLLISSGSSLHPGSRGRHLQRLRITPARATALSLAAAPEDHACQGHGFVTRCMGRITPARATALSLAARAGPIRARLAVGPYTCMALLMMCVRRTHESRSRGAACKRIARAGLLQCSHGCSAYCMVTD